MAKLNDILNLLEEVIIVRDREGRIKMWIKRQRRNTDGRLGKFWGRISEVSFPLEVSEPNLNSSENFIKPAVPNFWRLSGSLRMAGFLTFG
ncbi:hypothetical protein ISS30_01465 [bacterium]|nr:hypothetical protein [bacterium]